MNTFINLIIQLGILGFVCYLIMLIPMPAQVKNIIAGIMCLVLILFVLNSLGFAGHQPILK